MTAIKFELKPSKSDKSLPVLLKEATINWLENSTSHGIPNAIKSKSKIAKFIYIICFLISTAICIIFISNSMSSFLKFDVDTIITLKREDDFIFPSVTICNQNPFHIYRSINETNNALDTFKNMFNVSSIDLSQDLKQSNILRKRLNVILKDKFAILDYDTRKSLGFQYDEMFMNCLFDGKDCNITDFKYIYDYNYGNCFTYNWNENDLKRLERAGLSGALELELNSLTEYYHQLLNPTSGYIILVHYYTDLPQISEYGINLSPGFESRIRIQSERFIRLNYPFSDCITEFQDGNISLQMKYINAKRYTQTLCYKLCLEVLLLSNCGCVSAEYPVQNLNGSFKYNLCIKTYAASCQNKTNAMFKQNYTQLCPACKVECDVYRYSTAISVSQFPSESLINIRRSYYANKYQLYGLVSNDTLNLTTQNSEFVKKIREKTLKVTLYFQDLTTMTVKEVPRTNIEQLVGNIGGLLGLYIGISILSVVELFEYLIILLTIIFRHFCNKK